MFHRVLFSLKRLYLTCGNISTQFSLNYCETQQFYFMISHTCLIKRHTASDRHITRDYFVTYILHIIHII